MNIGSSPHPIKIYAVTKHKWSRSWQKKMPRPCYASPQHKAGRMQLQPNNPNHQISDDNVIIKIKMKIMIEQSLEVKLPTIWTDEKQRW
jgi:hypothetical protein